MLNFPNAPVVNQKFNNWTWDGTKWTVRVNDDAQYNNVGRNVIHNSMFRIAQRGAGPFTTNGYTLDRWVLATNLDTGVVLQRDTLTDGARTAIGDETAVYALHLQTTGNAGAAAYTETLHYIESVARLSGKTVTLSFWATASFAGMKFGIGCAQLFGTGGSPSAAVALPMQVITLTLAWARYSVTFNLPSMTGKTLGTNGNDYTLFQFVISSGATNFPLVGVQTGTVQMWGVQLEVGTVATPLEKIDIQTDLANCQRFYQVLTNLLISAGVAGPMYGGFTLPVIMRATPTVAITSPTYGGANSIALNAANSSNITLQATITGGAGSWATCTPTLSADL